MSQLARRISQSLLLRVPVETLRSSTTTILPRGASSNVSSWWCSTVAPLCLEPLEATDGKTAHHAKFLDRPMDRRRNRRRSGSFPVVPRRLTVTQRRWWASSTAVLARATATTRTPFLLADIGEGIKEVEVLQWFVQPGDSLHQFDKVCEVQSDKATVEITSRYDGVVSELAGQVGDMVQVGQPLLFIDSPVMESPATASDARSSPANGTTETPSTSPQSSNHRHDVSPSWQDAERLQIPSVASHYHLESDRDDDHDPSVGAPSPLEAGTFQASPAVRRLGKEYGMDLSTVHPSGPHGRLLKSDVVMYLKEQGRWRVDGNDDGSGVVAAHAASEPGPLDESTGERIVQLRGYHRLMAQTMTASLQIPHMCFGDELYVTPLLECRRHINERGNPEVPISLLAFLIKACSLALAEHPMVNATVHDAQACQLRVSPHHNIGIAVDTPRGLVVPVLHDVQNRTLVEVQCGIDSLKVRARESKLTGDDLQGATFTLSNIGVIGGTYMQPVIVPPQVAMGAVGRVQRLPRLASELQPAPMAGSASPQGLATVDPGAVVPAEVLHVSWAGDHRFLDGATLARFHATFKRLVEQPSFMLARMR